MKGPYRLVGSDWGKGEFRDRVGRRKVRDRNRVVGEVCKEFWVLWEIGRVPKLGTLIFWADGTLSCAHSRCPLYTGITPS